MNRALQRRLDSNVHRPNSTGRAFQEYSKRLVRDLEGKGVTRTAVETVNLAANINEKDDLAAECIYTFPKVAFPATLLLRREEVETHKAKGVSVIAAVGVAGAPGRKRLYIEAPFDLMYGFRGSGGEQWLLSPFEMIRYSVSKYPIDGHYVRNFITQIKYFVFTIVH